MGVLLIIGLFVGGAAVTSAIISVSDYVYITSEKIHMHLCGGYAPRRRGSMVSGL
jgi:hypothetical protein